MSIEIYMHRIHREFTNGQEVIETRGNTVGECLRDLIRQYPGMEKNVFVKNGKLNPVLEIYVNTESAYPEELAKRVKDGDQIHITLMLAGG